jgi:hypothetical protein
MRRFQHIDKFFAGLYYSFPVQLTLNHLKKNQILLFIWLILFAMISGNIGRNLGVPYLFLDPEYLNKVDWRGFMIIGIATAIFITSFHITTYILDSYKFNFLGGIRKPFTRFCLNNSLIPILFVAFYAVAMSKFQFKNGFQEKYEIYLEIMSFLIGVLGTLYLMFLYFRWTNQDIFKALADNVDAQLRKNPINRVNVMKKFDQKKKKNKVSWYVEMPLSLKKAPEHAIYEKSVYLKIFDQNHLNAVIVELFIISIVIILGLFRDIPFFQIPAAASAILFFSIIVMITGAITFWLKNWAITTVIVLLVTINMFTKYNIINTQYEAFGINYNTEKATYNLENLNNLSSAQNYYYDYQSTIQILEKWKAQFPANTKPKLVLICVSGGGQRSAVWTTNVLQFADSATNGQLMKHTRLITGASGGLIGASYFRELCLRKLQGENINPYQQQYLDNISKDVLNPIIFSMVVNDIFFRFQQFSDGRYEYLKDRGYAFEQQLNRNTDFVMNKKISDYRLPEEEAIIPMLLVSPTIVNDGRRLFISPQDVSYMTSASASVKSSMTQPIKGVEFRRMFADQDAESLHFLSALRMSATFPYVTPNISLPSEPRMEIMDAGLSDNFGTRDATRFLYVFKDWIAEYTSGVIIINIRDSEKIIPVDQKHETSMFTSILSPIGGLVGNIEYFQDYSNDNLIEYAQSWFPGTIDVVDFQYIPKPKNWDKLKERKIDPEEVERREKEERAALSWHLTVREKESLQRTILEKNNLTSLNTLKTLLNIP